MPLAAPSSSSFATKPCERFGAIAMQNANGPCPLLACVNALAARGETMSDVDDKRVGEVSVEACARRARESIAFRVELAKERGDVERALALERAIEHVEGLSTGAEVDVAFASCDSFVDNDAIGVFAACGLTLKHAWVVDVREHGEEAHGIASRATYNALVERLAHARDASAPKSRDGIERGEGERASDDDDDDDDAGRNRGKDVDYGDGCEPPGDDVEADMVARALAMSLGESSTRALEKRSRARDEDEKIARAMHECAVIEEFLTNTAGQCTQTGLEQMRQTMREGEYVVFFRNNHFSVAHKRGEQLYTLVTDQGYLDEPDVVWECLGGARDGEFVTASFAPFQAHGEVVLGDVIDAPSRASVRESDALPADFLRGARGEDERRILATPISIDASPNDAVARVALASSVDTDADYAAALQLQFDAEDEDRRRRETASTSDRARESDTPVAPARAPASVKAKSKSSSDCVIS